MTLNQLYYFCTIAQTLNFHRAAEIHHIAQPSLSTSIARLEEELGFMLFERKGRHIELTKYGRYYSEQVRPILSQLESVTEKARHIAHNVTGNIDIAYNVPFGRRLVPRIARCFLELPENRQCSFQFHQATSHAILDGLRSGRYDVGVCTIEPDIPDISYTPLMNQDLVAIVPRDHELADRESISLKELARFPYVAYSEDTGLSSLIEGFLESEGVSPNISARAPDEESIAALVAEGFGVSFVASIHALRNFDVVVLKIDREDCYRTIYMLHLKDHYLTPSVRRFIRYCTDTNIKWLMQNKILPANRKD